MRRPLQPFYETREVKHVTTGGEYKEAIPTTQGWLSAEVASFHGPQHIGVARCAGNINGNLLRYTAELHDFLLRAAHEGIEAINSGNQLRFEVPQHNIVTEVGEDVDHAEVLLVIRHRQPARKHVGGITAVGPPLPTAPTPAATTTIRRTRVTPI